MRVRGAYPNEAEGLYVHLGDLIEWLADQLADTTHVWDGEAADNVTSLLVGLGAEMEAS